MAKNFITDTSGSIEEVVKQVIREHKEFRIVRNLHFLYTFRVGDIQWDKDGLPIDSFTKKLSTRERDVYGKDIELCVHYDSWYDYTKDQKYRLIFRCLLGIHVEVEGKETIEIVLDDDGRIVFRCVPPDIVLRMFSKELEVFGLSSQYKSVLKKLVPSMKERGNANP